MDDVTARTAIGSVVVMLLSFALVTLLLRPFHRLVYPNRRPPSHEEMTVFTGAIIIVSMAFSPFLVLIPMAAFKVVDVIVYGMGGGGASSPFKWFMATVVYWWIGIFVLSCLSGIALMFRTISADPKAH